MAETPILNLREDPPAAKRTVGPYADFALVVGVFLLCLKSGWILPAAAFFAALAAHETGHLIAALVCGMSIGGMSVAGFTVFKSGRYWHGTFDYKSVFYGFVGA